jgi:hypothetical protein
MSANLTRLNISSVDDSGSSVGAYVKRVSIVEVVDSDGNPWEPVPGPDPWDALVVSDRAQWSDNNVYTVGSSISGVSATYIGGTDQVVYRSRTQHRPAGSGSWINSPWTNHANTPQVIGFTIPAGEENGEVRFQTQARDEGVEPVDQVNSFASIKGIAPLEWGAITQTIDDNTYDPNLDGAAVVAANSPILCSVSVANAPSDIRYEWSQRGTDPILIGTPTAAQTVITFPEQGVFTITVNLKSDKTAEWTSAIFNFMAS